MQNEKSLSQLKYETDYRGRYVAEACRLVKKGELYFAYNKEMLEDIENVLKKENIQYEINLTDGYWTIIPKNYKGRRT